uniref:Uncharacterized protein n=1 Tax=Pyxicephalus adspersus TaxID=30357 RepID=A0AAV3A3Q1_PYXAD|nr:TPA: hypothetical protein GDO54_010001 [Pyxicephalus adspersus]
MLLSRIKNFTIWPHICGHLTITLIEACWTSFSKTMDIKMELSPSLYHPPDFWEVFPQNIGISQPEERCKMRYECWTRRPSHNHNFFFFYKGVQNVNVGPL